MSRTLAEVTSWKARPGWAGVIALLVVIGLISAANNDDEAESAYDVPAYVPPEPTNSEVSYFVDVADPGEAEFAYGSITIETPDGSTTQDADFPLMNQSGQPGLHYVFEDGDFVYLSAMIEKEGVTITCRIVVDGETISENTASGIGIAQCDGSA